MAASVLESRLGRFLPAEVLAQLQAQVMAPVAPRLRVFRPVAPTVVELGPGDPTVVAVAALQAAMAELGVGDLVGPLTEVTLACADLHGRQVSNGSGEPEERVLGESDGQPGEQGPGHSGERDASEEHAEQPAVLARAKELLGVVESVTKVSNQLDAVLVGATRELTAARGQLLLGEKGVASIEELSSAQRDKWRSQAKSQTRHEIEAAIGWYAGEVTDLVGLAAAPVATLGPVLHGMRTGESSWLMARRFYREAGGLAHEESAKIANGLFGDDPGAAVSERVDSSGGWLGGPWRVGEFNRALAREVARVTAADEEAQQAARDRARANRDLRVRMDGDGTAEVTIGCTQLQAAAIADRVSTAAKSARKAGAPELLRELRAGIGAALLLHGTLDSSTLPDDPDLITVEQSAQLSKVLHGLPAAQIHVIVPFDTLIGHRTGSTATTATGEAVPAAFRNPASGSADGCMCRCTCGANPTATAGDGDAAGASGHDGTEPQSQPPTGQLCPKPGECCPAPGLPGGSAFYRPGGPGRAGAGPGDRASAGGTCGSGPAHGVGEVIGRERLFLMPEEVRLLALLPGSTLHRLLVDPAKGRCVERSIDAYPFDAKMRAQIIASDVFCRAPGCLRPARVAQLDHVQEHGTPGGHTCEANAQAVCEPHHDQKTKKAWDAVLESNRDVTWTTLLGRIYRTKAHDYRQYTKLLTAATTAVQDAIGVGGDRGEVIDAAIYQALSYRDPGEALASDDYEDLFNGWDMVTLTHIRDNGRRAYEPDPQVRQAEIDRHRTTREDGTADDDATQGNSGGPTDRDATSNDGGKAADGAATAEDSGTTDQDDTTDRDDTTGNNAPGADPETPWSHPNDEPPPF